MVAGVGDRDLHRDAAALRRRVAARLQRHRRLPDLRRITADRRKGREAVGRLAAVRAHIRPGERPGADLSGYRSAKKEADQHTCDRREPQHPSGRQRISCHLDLLLTPAVQGSDRPLVNSDRGKLSQPDWYQRMSSRWHKADSIHQECAGPRRAACRSSSLPIGSKSGGRERTRFRYLFASGDRQALIRLRAIATAPIWPFSDSGRSPQTRSTGIG